MQGCRMRVLVEFWELVVKSTMRLIRFRGVSCISGASPLQGCYLIKSVRSCEHFLWVEVGQANSKMFRDVQGCFLEFEIKQTL